MYAVEGDRKVQEQTFVFWQESSHGVGVSLSQEAQHTHLSALCAVTVDFSGSSSAPPPQAEFFCSTFIENPSCEKPAWALWMYVREQREPVLLDLTASQGGRKAAHVQ